MDFGRISDDDDDLPKIFGDFVDQRISPGDLARLEDRLRNDPQAREYCADRLQFEADLREAVDPPTLEWLETRRLILGGKGDRSSWEIQRSQSIRYGRTGESSASPPARRKKWAGWSYAIGLLLAGIMTGLWFLKPKQPEVNGSVNPVSEKAPTLSLRNGDFEATDLSLNASGSTYSLIDWQDFFQTKAASLQEIGRTSQGAIFAPSGRNVARMQHFSYLTQRLRFNDGNPLIAHPGLRIAVSGQAYADGPAPHIIYGALRFVASQHPDMIQYEAANSQLTIEPGEWRMFRLELVLNEDLRREPSDAEPGRVQRPILNVEGRELTLSLDSRGNDASIILVDDLRIELLSAGKP